MVFEALREYVQLATGLTDVTTTKARKAVKDLLAVGGTASDRCPTRWASSSMNSSPLVARIASRYER